MCTGNYIRIRQSFKVNKRRTSRYRQKAYQIVSPELHILRTRDKTYLSSSQSKATGIRRNLPVLRKHFVLSP
uniref:Uncharacterized protein n=1 Tax=Pararge aegeria TaxID=116150 RepID=S4PZ78_9NEOP